MPLEPPDDDVLEISAPPVLLDEPPVDVDPPLDVDDTTMLAPEPPLPPKPPPNPPPKPPPKNPPPLPPTTTGSAPAPPPPMYPEPTGVGIGTGAAFATDTTVGAQVVRVVVVTRRTRGRCTAAICGRATRLTRTRFVLAVRLGLSATWTAPPPIKAPPHAHAHNFAKAIRTDISSLFRCRHFAGCRIPARSIEPPLSD
ncbi:MAG TPA: hypothetical protein VNJ10_06140 [Sphingomonas sp.]|nr:hypothetical protein [Sphingomonas sp.]